MVVASAFITISSRFRRTSSRLTASISLLERASAADIVLKEAARVAISSCPATDTRCCKSPEAMASVARASWRTGRSTTEVSQQAASEPTVAAQTVSTTRKVVMPRRAAWTRACEIPTRTVPREACNGTATSQTRPCSVSSGLTEWLPPSGRGLALRSFSREATLERIGQHSLRAVKDEDVGDIAIESSTALQSFAQSGMAIFMGGAGDLVLNISCG